MNKKIDVPVTFVNSDQASAAWEEFRALMLQEAEIRRQRVDAYERFISAFSAEPK